MKIILASTSPFRKAQLEEAGFTFECIASNIDEESLKQKMNDPKELCQQLAFLKAQSVAEKHPDDLIIGGDQLVSFNGEILLQVTIR